MSTLVLQIESWPLTRLLASPTNARTHSARQVEQVAASIKEFGFVNPILADGDGRIIAGHCRLLAARKLALTHAPVIILKHLSELQKRALALADNRLALDAGWDEELLRLELQALDSEGVCLELTGFVERELKHLLAQPAQQEDPDQVPEPVALVVTRPQDLWILGDHRLLCGDGTNANNVERLLEGRLSDLVFTDLPYNCDYTGKTQRKLKLANDNLGEAFGEFLTQACRTLLAHTQGAIYICMSSAELHRLYSAFVQCGGHWSTFVIWAKSGFTLGRSDYQRQYEPILYGWPQGQRHYWCGARDQGDVWFINKPTVNAEHPTAKPVELIERALQNSSRRGDLVLDPFAGSGSTAIACHNLGRRARMLELLPTYADVIVRRWESYTGGTARLEQDGRSFSEIALEREQEAARDREAA